jgi:hypothetical protein
MRDGGFQMGPIGLILFLVERGERDFLPQMARIPLT